MNKKIAYSLLACFLMLGITSCNKADKNSTNIDSKYIIQGVDLYDINAQAMGSIGNPDTKTFSDSFVMVTYPIPCRSSITTTLQFSNTAPLKITATVVHVRYPAAPASYTYLQEQIPIIVENKDSVGKLAKTTSIDVEVTGGRQDKVLSFDVKNLPKGFYRLNIETSNGGKLWQNFFKE